MKRFYYTDKRDERSRKGDRIIRVYKLKAGKMEMVTHCEYRPGCTRGPEAEAFNALMECGEIPKKWYNSSNTGWSGPGYFSGPVTEHYSIQEVY